MIFYATFLKYYFCYKLQYLDGEIGLVISYLQEIENSESLFIPSLLWAGFPHLVVDESSPDGTANAVRTFREGMVIACFLEVDRISFGLEQATYMF